MCTVLSSNAKDVIVHFGRMFCRHVKAKKLLNVQVRSLTLKLHWNS